MRNELLCYLAPKGAEQDMVAKCSICGRTDTLFDLPGTTEKFCWGCSADFATIILLTDAIDSATLAGVSADDLQSELCDISSRILERSQLAELGSDLPQSSVKEGGDEHIIETKEKGNYRAPSNLQPGRDERDSKTWKLGT